MKLKIYQVDAFTSSLFGGNPAAVVPLTEWLSDAMLQNIAAENNLSETAFFVPEANGFHIRWFTPSAEVELCGHATIASSYVLYQVEGYGHNEILFDSKSGPLKVKKQDDWFTLDFPAYALTATEATNDILAAIGKTPTEMFSYKNDLLFVYHDQTSVEMIQPDFKKLAACKVRGVLVTAPGNNADFAYRFFATGVGVDEDPATGSAQCALIPYWAKRLGKNSLTSDQVSKRRGFLKSTLKSDRVEISGQAVLYLSGEITV
jgi:PhzF family phenazine biosynthesis protein